MCRWNAWSGAEALLAFVEFVPDLHVLLSGRQPLIFGQQAGGLLAFQNPLAGFVPAFITPMSYVPVLPTGAREYMALVGNSGVSPPHAPANEYSVHRRLDL